MNLRWGTLVWGAPVADPVWTWNHLPLPATPAATASIALPFTFERLDRLLAPPHTPRRATGLARTLAPGTDSAR